MKKKIKIILCVLVIIFNSGCGGGGDSSSNNTTTPIINNPPVDTGIIKASDILPVNTNTDRTASKWNISSSTSSLTGVKTTELILSSPSGGGADFHIYCTSEGEKGYYLTTDFITGSGRISYRIGDSPIVTEDWIESSNYKALIPRNIDMSLLDKLYKDWNVVFQIDKYNVGFVNVDMSNHGFSAAIDKSRSSCGWSTIDLPPDNGWGQEYPSLPPADAKEATYKPNSNNQFRLIAWKAPNSKGEPQLLIRIGDENGPCSGSLLITEDRLYIIQNNKKIPVMTGIYLRKSCSTPGIYALNGNFNVNEPFVLNSYDSLFSLGSQDQPIASVAFD